MQKILATVITGFLGAGKTSLIRHLLEHSNGRRIALVINEFGDLGIDSGVIDGCAIEGCTEDDIVELTNGCICCTVADDFLPTITALLERAEPPEHIVIETSGLALPKPLVKAFAWPDLKARVTVDGVVTVVDGPAALAGRFADDPAAVAAARQDDDALDHDNPLAELFEDQLGCADMVVLNKTDLLDGNGGLGRVRDLVAANLRAGVKTVAAAHGRLDPAVLLGLGAAAEDDIDNRRSHHDDEAEHDHDDFFSFTLTLPATGDPAALERRLKATVVAHDILRIKGFIDVPTKARRLVIQGVGDRFERYYDRDWRHGETRRSELVVIGTAGLDQRAITAAITGPS